MRWNIPKYFYNIIEVLESDRFYAVVPKDYVEVGEISSLSELEDPLNTDHPLVKSDIAEEMSRKLYGRNLLEVLKTALALVRKNVVYDSIHANASVNWRTMAYTYMTAHEALMAGRGICGEQSLALISILRYRGIKAGLIRPSFSHLAVLVEAGDNTFYKIDTVSGMIYTHVGRLKRFARTPESKYVIGAISLDEFNETTVSRRKRFGYNIKRNISAMEALDLEYVRHCMSPPYNTDLGLAFLSWLMDIGYCRNLIMNESLAIIFGDIIAQCPRPETRVTKQCYDEAWNRYLLRLEAMKRIGGRYWRRYLSM